MKPAVLNAPVVIATALLYAWQEAWEDRMGRKLTTDEKAAIEAYAREHADPARGRVVSVRVEDELDDEGRVHFTTNYIETTVMPRDWKP